MSNCGYLHYRELFYKCIVTGMVAKRSFGCKISWINKPLDYKIYIFGYINIVCNRFNQLSIFIAYKPVKQQFKHTVRHWRLSAPNIERVAPYSNAYRHLFARFSVLVKKVARIFMDLPVHCQFVFIQLLQAIHPDILHIAIQTLRVNLPHCNKAPAVFFPCFKNWQFV